jgi:hypothetical protein
MMRSEISSSITKSNTAWDKAREMKQRRMAIESNGRLDLDYAAAVRTRGEIADAIRVLTPAQSARLRLLAKKYAWRCPLGLDDLLQEAFPRALKGDRKCHAHIDVVKFFAEAMPIAPAARTADGLILGLLFGNYRSS